MAIVFIRCVDSPRQSLHRVRKIIDFGREIGQYHIATREAAMATMRQAESVLADEKNRDRVHHGDGPTEDQVNIRGAVAQRIDKKGTKIEELAGTDEHDGIGG